MYNLWSLGIYRKILELICCDYSWPSLYDNSTSSILLVYNTNISVTNPMSKLKVVDSNYFLFISIYFPFILFLELELGLE